MWDLVWWCLDGAVLRLRRAVVPEYLVGLWSLSSSAGSVWRRLAAVGTGLYPPRREGLLEVAVGTVALCAVEVVGVGAVWYPPEELRLERCAAGNWLGGWVISAWTSLRLGDMLR